MHAAVCSFDRVSTDGKPRAGFLTSGEWGGWAKVCLTPGGLRRPKVPLKPLSHPHSAPPEKGGGGINRLGQSLYDVVQKVEQPTLEERWEAVGAYLDNYVSLADDEGVRKEIVQRLDTSRDSEAVTASLHLLSSHLASSRPEIAEALRCIDLSFTRLVKDGVVGAPSVANSIDREAMNGARILESDLKELLLHGTHPRDLLVRQGVVSSGKSTRAASAANRALRYWQTAFLGRLLVGWRNGVQHRKEAVQARKEMDGLAAELAKEQQRAAKREKEREQQYEDLRRQVELLRKELRVAEKGQEEAEQQCRALEDALQHKADAVEAARGEVEKDEAKKIATLEDEYRNLEGLLGTVVSNELASGSPSEECLQDYLLAHFERWKDLPLTSMLTTLANTCMQPHPASAMYLLDPDEGFMNAERELGALFLTMHRVAPNLVTPDLVDAFVEEVDPLRQADIILDGLREMDIVTTVTPMQLVQDDGRGIARQQVLASVLLRVLDPEAWKTSPVSYVWYGEEVDPEVYTVRPVLPRKEQPKDVEGDVVLHITQAIERRKAIQDRRTKLVAQLMVGLMTSMRDPEVKGPTIAERRDLDMFTTPPLSVIEQLVGDGDVEETVKEVGSALEERFRMLRQVFKFYACSEPIKRPEALSDNVMARSEFERLVQDCDLKVDVDKVWPPGEGALTPRLYIETLVRLAALEDEVGTTSSQRGSRVTWTGDVASRLRSILDTHILPKADYVSTAEFKETVHKERSEEVIHEYRPLLHKVFVHYASGRETNDTFEQTVKETKEISYKEFKQLMSDSNVYDSYCTHYAVQQAFIKMQDDYDLGLSFSEYIEVLCAVAALKNPAPFIPLHIRLRRFLEKVFLPPLQKKLRLPSSTRGPRHGRRSSCASSAGSFRKTPRKRFA